MTIQPSILIVDSSKQDRELLRKLLEEYFHDAAKLHEASAVGIALDVLEGGNNVDCVLVSRRVVDFSVEALDRLARRPNEISTPVVLVVDEDDDASATEALKAGVQDVVYRGRLGTVEPHRAVRNALETVRMRRELEEQRQALEKGTGEPPMLDSVTELPNRHLFRQHLSRALSRVSEESTTGVMLIGLDGFKAINSSFGHRVGDELLKMVAGRLRHCVRNADTIARWGGDEFAALLEEMSRPEDAIFVAQRIMYALSRPFVYRGQDLYITASVGIAIHPADGEEGEVLLQHADTAMYRVKHGGGNNYRIYSSQMNVNLTDRLAVGSRLRSALKRNEFSLYYQPQLDMVSGSVIGLEALLRWNDPVDGMRSPAEFIPILEETGLIIPVGEWVIRKACTQARAWQYAGLANLRVAVNLSAKQFRQRELAKSVATILTETGLSPDSLQLELTESVLMDDQAYSGRVLSELKDMGSLIALDDFGTGYSSLGFLKAFPVDTLKIDRTFIRDIGVDEDDRSICSAIVALGRALRLHVVAEGVETEEQLAILRDQGCHLVQGFLYARPMPAEEVWQWLVEEGPTETTETAS